MIRPATAGDALAIVRMTFDLAGATRQPLPLSAPHVFAFVNQVLAAGDAALALVVDKGAGPVGMLVATEGVSPLSPVRLGIEHGWWCGPDARRYGMALLDRYEAWARARGLYAIRMSTPADAALRGGLARRCFSPVEQAWVKVL